MTTGNVVVRLKKVQEDTALSRAFIYLKLDKASPYYDPDFPQPIKLGNGRSIGFVLKEVQEWITKRMEDRDG